MIIVCKVLGPEKQKGLGMLFFWQLFGKVSLLFFGGGGFLPVFMYHKRRFGLSL